MNTMLRRIRLFVCAALLVGCISPQNTRLPTLRPSPNIAAERQSYVYHNPLPDNEAGPPAIDLPRGFDRPRSQPTQVKERSDITDSIIGTSGGSSNNPSASRYPASVNP
jgi:hypothetical protein